MNGVPAASSSAPAVEASGGRVVIGKAPPGAILLLEPQDAREFPDQVGKPMMDQVSMTFTPNVLFVRTGQPVEFRNSDEELHNINVKDDATKEQAFNVAIPTGATYGFTFKRDGLYNVRCDIHAAMAALIVASATPYTQIADNEGNFAFEDVLPGSYTLTAYAGTDKLSKKVDVTQPRTQLVIEK